MKAYCTNCDKDVDYKVEKRSVLEFKNANINSYENVAVCSKCHHDIYISKLEDENIKRINQAYLKETNIISPKEIIDFRNKYNISQRELTSILGFGKMTINRYENGFIPTKSQSDYLKAIISNTKQFMELVEVANVTGRITKRTYEKIKNVNDDLFDLNEEARKHIEYSLNKPLSEYNGYHEFDIELIENILSYIASKVNNLTLTSMNKYLNYIDMLSFKENTVGITGIIYQKQQYGPTIFDRRYEEISKLDEKYQRIDSENKNGDLTTVIKSKNNYDLDLIGKENLKIIDKVIDKLKNKTVSQISELSHKEDEWTKTNDFEKISYNYAMSLKAF